MNDIQVIEPARNKYFARPKHRDLLTLGTPPGQVTTLREGYVRCCKDWPAVGTAPSGVYHLWQHVKRGEAEALQVH